MLPAYSIAGQTESHMEQPKKESKARKGIPLERQVRVLFRDKWLCHLCGYPTIFAPALKYLQKMVTARAATSSPLAYYEFRYRHDAAPLLDYLACVVDHREAHARGGSGEESNLATACNKCNMRKNDQSYVQHVKKFPRRKVKARYGSPQHWDGFASLFVALAPDFADDITVQERGWLNAFTAFFAARQSELPNKALQQTAGSAGRSWTPGR